MVSLSYVLLVFVALAQAKKKIQAVSVLKQDMLRGLLGVKPGFRGEVADCGAVLYLMAPITSNDDDTQRREQDHQRNVAKGLRQLKKAVARDDVVAFGKFPFAPNKIFMRTYTTAETFTDEWQASIVFAKAPPPELRKRWTQRQTKLQFEKLKDDSVAGIARYLNENCGTNIAKVGGKKIKASRRSKSADDEL